TGSPRPSLPEMAGEIDRAFGGDADALPAQAAGLLAAPLVAARAAPSAGADAPLGVDHAVPGNRPALDAQIVRQRPHRPTDRAGAAGKTGDAGDLAVGRHASAGDPRHDLPDGPEG